MKKDGKTIKCEDIDECKDPNTCPKHSTCKNLVGSKFLPPHHQMDSLRNPKFLTSRKFRFSIRLAFWLESKSNRKQAAKKSKIENRSLSTSRPRLSSVGYGLDPGLGPYHTDMYILFAFSAFECICQPPTIQHGLQDCVANATCPECHKHAICLKSTRDNGDVYNCTCSTGYRGDGIKNCERKFFIN